MEELHLRQNQITWLPAEIGGMTNLKELDLQRNNLTKLPAQIAYLTNLEIIHLWFNDFSEDEKAKIEGWLPNCDIRW